jgi:phenylacetate-CoA ligase
MTPRDIADWLNFWRRPHFSQERIRAYQDQRVRRLVRHAWEKIPYYRRLLDGAGVRPADIRSVADLARIPISRRENLQRVPNQDRIAPDVDATKCFTFMTSGSTGQPVRFLRTRFEQYLLFGFRLRAQLLAGVRPTDRRVKLGSTPVRLMPHRLGLFRISNIELNLGSGEILRRLKALRPEVIYGIPNMFEMMLAAEREELQALRPRMILSGAELLSPSLRRELEDVFQCPVVDFYGCHELNLIAWGCVQCGLYHSSDDSAVIEVLKSDGQPAGPGEEGEVIGTALHSYAMPLIRIEVGDVVSRPERPASCGIGFGAISQIRGRTADFLPVPGGHLLSPYPLTLAVDAAPGVHRFQIVQEAVDRITVNFIPLAGDAQQAAQAIVANCRRELPPDVTVEARPVANIPLTKAGKQRLVQALRVP